MTAKYRPCQLSDLRNVGRETEIKYYTVDSDGQPQLHVDSDFDANHAYGESSEEYECTNAHQDIMTEDLFDGWEEAQQHLRDYGENK